MEDEKFSSYYRMPINQCGRMVELENYHLANIRVVINSGKKHQWVLKQIRKNRMSYGISMILIH